MKLELRPATEADHRAVADVAADAIEARYHNEPRSGAYVNATWPRITTPAGRANAALRIGHYAASETPEGLLAKVVDVDADDRIIGMALWETHREMPQEVEPLELGDYWASEEEKEWGQHVWNLAEGEMLKHYKTLSVPFMILKIMMVHHDYQRKGVGGMLMRDGLARADALEAPVIVSASNPGRGLYEAFGFVILEGQPKMMKTDEKWGSKGGDIGVQLLVRPAQER